MLPHKATIKAKGQIEKRDSTKTNNCSRFCDMALRAFTG